MAIGTSLRNGITGVINKLGSTFTITPITVSSNVGGYEPNTETDGTAVSVTAVLDRQEKISRMLGLGHMATGTFRLWMKYSETIALDTATTKYKIVWQSETFDVKEFRPYYIENTLIAQMIILAKRL